MRPNLALLLALVLSCPPVWANDTERLSQATEQYSRCLDNVLGGFPTDKDAQAAARRISAEMLKNIRAMVALERKSSSTTTKFWLEILGEEAFIGYLFRSYSDGTERYRKEKQALKELNNFDWRITERKLWSENGCDAIHTQLAR